MKIKGWHRKRTDNCSSNHTGAKEINGSQERSLGSRVPGEAVLCHRNNFGCSCDWLCHFGQSTSLSFSFLMDNVGTFYFLKLYIYIFLMGFSVLLSFLIQLPCGAYLLSPSVCCTVLGPHTGCLWLLTTTLWGQYYCYPHLLMGAAEAQRGWDTVTQLNVAEMWSRPR